MCLYHGCRFFKRQPSQFFLSFFLFLFALESVSYSVSFSLIVVVTCLLMSDKYVNGPLLYWPQLYVVVCKRSIHTLIIQ